MPEPAPIALTTLEVALLWLVAADAVEVPVVVDGTAVDDVELPMLVAMGFLTSTRYGSAHPEKTQARPT